MKENEINKYYDICPNMDKNGFMQLLLPLIAQNNPSYEFDIVDGKAKVSEVKKAVIPFNYKEVIAEELKNKPMSYAKVLDIMQFFKYQVRFETDFSKALQDYINVFRSHDYSINMEEECIEVPFTESAIKNLLNQFSEEEINEASMLSFALIEAVNKRQRDLEHAEDKKETEEYIKKAYGYKEKRKSLIGFLSK